jgi:hypothetical protein
MTLIRQSRRRFLKSLAASGGTALLAPRVAAPIEAAPAASDLSGLRDKIDHLVVVFQENRSFDHYFGAYRPARGGAVAGLLDREGRVDARFAGLQKNPAGVPYGHLPVHNAAFAVAPAEAASALVADRAGQAREILCLQEERRVGNENTVKWGGRSLQIPPSRLRPHFVRAMDRVHEYPNGGPAIFQGPHRLADYDAEGNLRDDTRLAA